MEEYTQEKKGLANNLESVIRKEEPFTVHLQPTGFEGIMFLSDDIDTDDPGFVDFYLKSRLVVSANKDHMAFYIIKDASEYDNLI